MQQALKSIALCAALCGPGASWGQPAPLPPQNVVQLSASGSVEVQQDLLVMSLNATRDGADPTQVQGQLRSLLDAALTEARKAALPGQMDVRTGQFGLYPRYGRDGKISGWQGTAELVLEGRDFARISSTAPKLTGMAVGHVGFGLSREQRSRVEAVAQQRAIDGFKAKAADLARGFGFSGFTLREVAVNANEPGFARPRMMAMEARASAAPADAPLPVEPGKSTVVVTVSGSVQMK